MSEYTIQQVVAKGKNIISIEADALNKLEKSIDENFAQAVEMINNCTGKVLVTGTGKSGLIGRKISATMSCCNIPSIFLNPYECENGDLGVVRKNDLLIAISNSGETGVLKHLVVPSCKELGCKVIALTGNLDSWLAKESDTSLYIGVEKEACYLNINASASTTSTLAMGDALALTAMELRGTTREQTYFLHQGGAWGKTLKEELMK